MKINTGTSGEWASFTGLTEGTTSGGVTRMTATGLVRGLKKDATSLTDNDTSIQKDHAVGTQMKLVHHSAQINKLPQIDADNTLSGDNTVTGSITISNTTKSALIVQSATTTQRDAFTTTTNGNIIYNSTAGEFQIYQGGAWSTVASGSTQPDGSTTVAGKYESATVAEQITLTATGSTGARLIAEVANMVNTSAGAGDEGKIALLDSSGTYDGTTLPDGLAKYVARANHTGVQASNTINDSGTAGETLAAGDWVYEDSADGKLNKATNNVATDSESWNVLGVIITGGALDATVTYQPIGEWTTTGLTAGEVYYLSTGGAITTTVPALNDGDIVPMIVGRAKDTTTLVINYQRIPRRFFTTGSNTTASGTTTHTVGFPISYVRYEGRAQNGTSPNSGTGYYDVIANVQACYTNYTTGSSLVATYGGGTSGGKLIGTGSVDGNNDLVITWSGSGLTGTHRYMVYIYENIT